MVSLRTKMYSRHADAVDAWLPGIDAARRAVRQATDAIVWLHLAKTGGTTVNTAFRMNSAWNAAVFPQSSQRLGQLCFCNDPACDNARQAFDAMRELASNQPSAKRLRVSNGHATFAETRWLARAISSRGHSPPILMSVRPARQRLVSLFRDYWNTYHLAAMTSDELRAAKGTDPSFRWTPHDHAKRRKLFTDSQRFLLGDGRIDGRLWFNSFNPGRGYPFWLHEVFDEPRQLANAMESGELRVVPISKLDDLIVEFTNQAPHRFRESAARRPEVEAALEESQDIIDRLSSQDDAYDALLTERFGADFAGSTHVTNK
jgi:hypothetical protein